MTNCLKHLFMYLFAICISSPVKCLFKSLTHFFSFLDYFLVIEFSESFTKRLQFTSTLSDLQFANVSSSCVPCLLVFLDCLSKSRIFSYKV